MIHRPSAEVTPTFAGFRVEFEAIEPLADITETGELNPF